MTEIEKLIDRFALEARDEHLGEALYGLSARLLLTGWLDDETNHAAYEKVVSTYGKPFIKIDDDLLAGALADALVQYLDASHLDLAEDLRNALAIRGGKIVWGDK